MLSVHIPKVHPHILHILLCVAKVSNQDSKNLCAVDKTAGSWKWKRFKRTEQQMRLVKKGLKDDKLDRRSPHNALHSVRATTVEVVTVQDYIGSGHC